MERNRPFDGVTITLDAHGSDRGTMTGIGKYGRTLRSALDGLGAEVHWLFGRNSYSGHSLEEEVGFLDPPQPKTGARRMLQSLGRIASAVTASTIRARHLPEPRTSIEADWDIGGYNARNLYSSAQFRHALLGKITNVVLPDRCDIVHLTAPLPVSVRNAKRAVTIHDIVPLKLPTTTLDDKHRYLQLLRFSVGNADLICTVSEASRVDIIEHLGASPEKVYNTYQAPSMPPLSVADRGESPRVLKRYGLMAGAYALFVGAIEPKKNVRRLLEAFLESDLDISLVLAGPRAWLWEAELAPLANIEGTPQRSRVRCLGYVPDADLSHLVACATFLVFPSLLEGFGLPVVEAMQNGCPVITSRTPALEEVTSGAALLVDPYSRAELRRALELLSQDSAARKRLSVAGLARAEFFAADRYRERVLDAYRLVL